MQIEDLKIVYILIYIIRLLLGRQPKNNMENRDDIKPGWALRGKKHTPTLLQLAIQWLFRANNVYHRTPSINSQCRSMLIKILALIPMSINSDQLRDFRINAMILICIDRHWALIGGVLSSIGPIKGGMNVGCRLEFFGNVRC